jgi:hypothetical protein
MIGTTRVSHPSFTKYIGSISWGPRTPDYAPTTHRSFCNVISLTYSGMFLYLELATYSNRLEVSKR